MQATEPQSQLQRLGAAAGAQWARVASEDELARLAEHWPVTESTETDDAYGAPGVFLRMVMPEDEPVWRSDIDEFWTNHCEDWEGNLGPEDLADLEDEDEGEVNAGESPVKYRAEFWDAFIPAALEVYEDGAARSNAA